MDQITFIVDSLKKDPFNENISLVEFDSKSPIELLQIMNNVFAVLDSAQKKNVREEDEATRTTRMLQFLAVLKPKQNINTETFIKSFSSGSASVIHPLLYWLLSNFSKVKERANLSKYLMDIPQVPETAYADQVFMNNWENFKKLQQTFKEQYKATRKLRPTAMNPETLAKEINQLNTDKEQLVAKLKKMRAKVYSGEAHEQVENFDGVLKCTQDLRKAQDEEAKLYRESQEIRQRTQRADARKSKLLAKLRTMERSQNNNSSSKALYARMKQEVNEQRITLTEKLEEALFTTQKKLHDLERHVMSDPVSLDELDELEAVVNGMMSQIRHLTELREKQLSNSEVKQMQRYFAAQEKEKEVALENLEQAEEEAREYEEDLTVLRADLDNLRSNSTESKSEQDIDAYMRQLKVRSEKFAKVRAMISAGKDELKVLNRTKEILSKQAKNMEEFNEKLEKQLGVEGFRDAASNLEKLSQHSDSVNQQKGQTSKEMTRQVKEIMNTLKMKKSNLGPAIKALKDKRNDHGNVQREFNKQKSEHDNIANGLDAERIGLRRDVEDSVHAMQADESAYHHMNTLRSINAVRVNLVQFEEELVNNGQRLSDQFANYQEMFDRHTQALEAEAKALRQEKKTTKESHGENVKQRQLYVQLKALMDAKLAIKQKQVKAEKEEYLSGAMDLSAMGVDRIVMDDDDETQSKDFS